MPLGIKMIKTYKTINIPERAEALGKSASQFRMAVCRRNKWQVFQTVGNMAAIALVCPVSKRQRVLKMQPWPWVDIQAKLSALYNGLGLLVSKFAILAVGVG